MEVRMSKPQMSKEEFVAHLHLIGMKPGPNGHKPYTQRWHRVVEDNVIMVDFEARYPVYAKAVVSLNGTGRKAGSYARAWQLIQDAINKEGVWKKLLATEWLLENVNLSPPS